MMFKSRFKIYDEDDFEITPYINNRVFCELIRDIINLQADEPKLTRQAYAIVERYPNAFADIKNDIRLKVKQASSMKLRQVANKWDDLVKYFFEADKVGKSEVISFHEQYQEKLLDALYSLAQIFDDLE